MIKPLTLRKFFLPAWLSLTLSILFFHPLIASLNDNIIIMQWRIINTFELLVAIALLTLSLTVLLSLAESYIGIHYKPLLLVLILIIPLISFGTYFLSQLGYKGDLINLGDYVSEHKIFFIFAGIFTLGALACAVVKYSTPSFSIILALIIFLSPINFVAAWVIWKSSTVNTSIYLEENEISSHASSQALENNMIILLFDEMSYNFLYRNNFIDSKYPNFKYLSSISNNYHSATSPGNQTLTSIPGLLSCQRYEKIEMKYNSIFSYPRAEKKEVLDIRSNNLFSLAKEKGLKTFLFGSYLPYCELCSADLNACRSYSIYNHGTIKRNFSLLNPFLTTFNIWPRQYPQGIIKNRSISKWQKEQTEEIYTLTMKVLDSSEPFLIFTHFYFTHVPFVYRKTGYYTNKDPFLESPENYRNQLDYADHILGKFIDRLKKNNKFETSTIILLSDHNIRSMYPENKNAIPLIVKGVGQKSKKDFNSPVNAEVILFDELRRLHSKSEASFSR